MASCLDDVEYSKTSPVVATFEYSGVDYEQIFGKDSLYFDDEAGVGIGWDCLAFLHKVDTVKNEFKGGMLLSYLKGRTLDPLDTLMMSRSDSLVFADDRFRANAVTGHAESKTYMVFCDEPDPADMPEHDVEFLAVEFGSCQMSHCYVNNTGYVAYKVAQAFEPGDRLTLKATGYLDGQVTGEASMSLADFSAQKDSIVSTWTAFDLTKLGKVEYVDFKVESTKEDVPGYFCMDSFVTSVTISY